jgi:dTDP-4-dehydrorhamnose 3,5-epimerase
VIFRDTPLDGVIVIEPERIEDERGHFARTWCHEAFEAHGILTKFVQCNTSFNHRRGTLRGLHYQVLPHEEAKLIRCKRGRIFDVAVDVRAGSTTRGKWCATELSADDGRMVFIPGGFAHGFQTLEDASEMFYQMSAAYAPEAARGARWNDPELGIEWPLADPIISEHDHRMPLFSASVDTADAELAISDTLAAVQRSALGRLTRLHG